jgi:hypothetical protein
MAMFSQRRSPIHQAMRRLARYLDTAGIRYAIVGAMAVNAHGVERGTDDVDVLLTREGLERFRQQFAGPVYDLLPGRWRHFAEKESGVPIAVVLTGFHPGREGRGPVTFPDPTDGVVEIGNIAVVSLLQLSPLKLAARRYYDLGDVSRLIRVHDLNEAFAENLHPSVRRDYLSCLEENRRDDAFNAREG